MTATMVEGRADRKSGAGLRRLLFAVTALVAGGAGVGSTLLYQGLTAPDTSAVDAQAAGLAEGLRRSLNAGFYSGGGTFGGQFTEGTVVARVQAHGGVLLSSRTERGNFPGGSLHTAEVMLGLVPPADSGTVEPDAYPVRCYRYTFGVGTYSVKQSDLPCPTSRTDGRPGSLIAQMGVLLAHQPTGSSAYSPLATTGYPHTPQGALKFLKDKHLIGAGDEVSAPSGTTEKAGVYALALRINGACHYLRMDSSPTASDLIPLWTAPADEQETCAAQHAAAAAALYGINPAQQG